jgi:hypothetical protein
MGETNKKTIVAGAGIDGVTTGFVRIVAAGFSRVEQLLTQRVDAVVSERSCTHGLLCGKRAADYADALAG